MRIASRLYGHIVAGIVCMIAAWSAPSAFAQGVEGSYPHGNWVDSKSGHEGPLRAHFRQVDDCHYRAVFTGRFFKVIPFRFATTLNVVGHDGDKVIFAGESRVGVFGRFSYEGFGDSNQFHADYSASKWRGEFNLSR